MTPEAHAPTPQELAAMVLEAIRHEEVLPDPCPGCGAESALAALVVEAAEARRLRAALERGASMRQEWDDHNVHDEGDFDFVEHFWRLLNIVEEPLAAAVSEETP